MTIAENQLVTWSNQGATTSSQATYASIDKALASYSKWPNDMDSLSYLQGSYRNSTNIRGDSDVDVVVELTSVSYSNLLPHEKAQLGLVQAKYTWTDFRQHVLAALVSYYGSSAVDATGKKAIRVLAAPGRLKADVVVAATYNYYENFRIRSAGITFFEQGSGAQIVNYPKVHFENGAAKNNAHNTNGRYKPTIRMFKNARIRVVDADASRKGMYPSYFIEGLLYNVPNECYVASYQATYRNVVNWLQEELASSRADGFVCQSNMHYLFGSSSVQWDKSKAQDLVTRLIRLWEMG
ncbi:MAG TPA: nucleotidyltransferase [Anaerolineales bacterium]|nr:nucleotidyltransferase [Anaerolineales bacterium]